MARVSPRYVAVAGVTAYRIAFGSRRTSIGPQAGTLGPARLWVPLFFRPPQGSPQ